MQITAYGHACFSIVLGGKTILFDPFISGNELAKDVDIDAIKADYILLSHGHQDHVLDVERIMGNNEGCVIVSNYEIVTWFGGKGLQGHPMNHGGSWSFDFGKVKYVNAVHSSMLPDGSYGGNPGGFVIEAEEGTIYYAGDTALTYDMKLIGESHQVDVAFLPIGDNFTMGVADAVLASQFVKCQQIIGMHYDTFGYIKVDHAQAKAAFVDGGAALHLPAIGETITF